MQRRQRNLQGFTLVELLIVVAIIGILSTIGIPTFKRMVQKAKKSEAKVALGGIYTSQAAFFSEYGAYGTNLDKMGFELEGSSANRFYSVGFPTAGCGNITVHLPASGNTFGTPIFAAFPQFYTTPDASNRSVLNRAGGIDNCLIGNTPASMNVFTATASGIVAPGIAPGGSTSAQQDRWTIDENRQLSNVNDGVQ